MSLIRDIAHQVVARPLIYDTVQRLVGRDYVASRLHPYLAETANSSLVDIGAGTGLYLSSLPADVRYIWLDNDRDKLAGFQSKGTAFPALLGDGAQLALKDKSVDYALCVSITHHLTDEQLLLMCRELARIVRKKLILVDALDTPAWQSALLWHYDRGSHPRTAEHLTSIVETAFTIKSSERFAVHHRYIILTGQPRR